MFSIFTRFRAGKKSNNTKIMEFFDRPNLAGRSIPGGPGAQGLRALSRMAKRWETASGENFTQLGLVLSLRGIFTFGMKRQ